MRYLPVLFFVAFLLPSIARADILPDNEHSISNCIAVSNTSDYPDYWFAWKIDGWRGISGSERITSPDPMCGVTGSYMLLAIKKTDWSKVQYGIDDSGNDSGNPADMWTQDPQNADLFISSNYTASFDRFAPNTSDVSNVYTTAYIDAVSDTGVTAHTASTLSTDSNGEPISEAETEGNTLTTLAKILIAVGIFGLGFACRAWKKK